MARRHKLLFRFFLVIFTIMSLPYILSIQNLQNREEDSVPLAIYDGVAISFPIQDEILMILDKVTCRNGWTKRASPRKVVDVIIFSQEIDSLEIRLRELDAVVDKFVILESSKTFTNLDKPMKFHLLRSDPRFKPFLHKIEYIRLDRSEGISWLD